MSEPRASVLVVDDERNTRTLLDYTLRRAGFQVSIAENGRQALECMNEDIDAVLLDIRMPEMDGLTCLTHLRKQHPHAQVIMLTGHGQIGDAVEAMKGGALDYVTKPFDGDALVSLLRQATRNNQLDRENRQLRSAVSDARPLVRFIGDSQGAERLRHQVEKVAALDSNVLVTGESGVGKGLLARMIHQASARADGPLVTVNCTVLPRELVESELFGHERGAFTGAVERRIGRVEMADGGTLFLDEVGDMPMDLQPKLLTFLQDRLFHRVGGDREIRADVRIVAATNHDLAAMCESRAFRQDLYYRLNVLPLRVPPLRERRGDIPILARHVLELVARGRGRRGYRLTDTALAAMTCYDWPGNVRELENALERASAFCEDGVIDAGDLPVEVRRPRAADETDPGRPELHDLGGIPLLELERMAIIQTLDLCGGNKSEAARRLGISEKSIYNKMERLGISRPARARE